MKRISIFLAFLVMLAVMLIGMPDSSQIQVDRKPLPSSQKKVVASFGKGKAYLASGNYLPEKIDAKVASTESILVRPKTDKTLRKGLMMNAFKGKKFSNSKALFKKALAKSLNLRASKEIRNNLYVVSGANVNPAKVKAAFNDQSYHLIEPDYKVKLQDLSINDSRRRELWGLGTPKESYGINAEAVWPLEDDITDDVIVGVMDTGVNCNHVDLEGVCWRNPDEIEGDGIDNDENGYVDDVSGYNFVDRNNKPYDDEREGHGTHVSGTIAAIRNNHAAIAGVTSKAKILPLKFLNKNGKGRISDTISAIEYAIQLRKAGYNLRVLSMSYSIKAYDSNSRVAIGGSIEEYNVIKDAGDAGITAVIAAGNDDGVGDAYPAAHNLDNIISVAAHQNFVDGKRNTILASFSNYGPTVHISAPGFGILSLNNCGNVSMKTLNGTSMAAPHVSGVVAILAGLFPEAKPADYRNWIINGGYKVPSLADKVVSGAILDAVGAVEEGYKATNNQNERISIAGYVLETGPLRIVGVPDVTVALEIKKSNKSNFVKTVKTDDSGRFNFRVNSSYIGKDFTLTASDGETMYSVYSGKVSASNMLVPSLTYFNTDMVKTRIHVLNENLQIVNDRGFNIRADYLDRLGNASYNIGKKTTVGFEKSLNTRTNLNTFYSLITDDENHFLYGYPNPIELNNPTEDREVVFLPEGKEKLTGQCELPAPFIANLGSNSIEVNMKPFSGVEYKNRKDLTAVYHVSVKNLNTKESIVKESYLPKLTINNLEKGRYRVRYLVNIVDSSGKGVSWNGQWSPAKDAYVGYPIDTVFPESHLYKGITDYYYNQGYLEACAPIKDIVYKNYKKKELTLKILFRLRNLSTKKIVMREVSKLRHDNFFEYDNMYYLCAHFEDSEPDAYELRYKYNFIRDGKNITSTEYSDPDYYVLGYPYGTVHPNMKHDDFIIGFSPVYNTAVYSGITGYAFKKRFRITNPNTGELSYTDNLRNLLLKGHYMVQYHYLIMDGSEILARTPWSNYADYIVE